MRPAVADTVTPILICDCAAPANVSIAAAKPQMMICTSSLVVVVVRAPRGNPPTDRLGAAAMLPLRVRLAMVLYGAEGHGETWRTSCNRAAIAALAFACAAPAADPNKVLRVAVNDIDTLDPHQYNDNPSFEVLISIFEPLYEWDYLESPPKLSPLTATAPIDISDGGKRWTMRVKPGIFFTDDPAFKGKPRELVAEDYVYSYKRWLDPNGRRGGAPIITDLIVGARAVVDAARASGKFDYARPIEGMRALDRYTLELRLTDADYANVQDMIGFAGAAAREVVEAAGDDIRSRAVGTGPFRLREWKRGSRIVLDANPGYRKAHFPAGGDPARAALVKSMQGKPRRSAWSKSTSSTKRSRACCSSSRAIDYLALRVRSPAGCWRTES